MRKEVLWVLGFVILLGTVLATPISDELHLNIQVTYSNGTIETGVFNFVFNISNSSDCNSSNVLYSDSAIIATDSRGLVSYYLPNVTLPFDQQYWLCYYRNDTLIETAKFSRQPYAFSSNDSDYLSGHSPSFFMPLNTSVYGDFNFNGGWQNGGISLIGGGVYTQSLYVANFSNLNVSTLNINGSLIPYNGLDNQFNVGSPSLRWNNLYLGGNLVSNGTIYENGVPLSNEYYSVSNPAGYLLWSQVTNGTLAFASALSSYYLKSNPYGYYNSTTLDLSTLTSGSVFVNSSNGYVGIGTVSPTQKLEVSGNINVTGSAVSIGTASGGDQGLILARGSDTGGPNAIGAFPGWNSSMLYINTYSSSGQKQSFSAGTQITGNVYVTGNVNANGGRVYDKTGYAGIPGEVVMYAGSTAPQGWLICDGSAVSRTTYADLFAAIGTTYGTGDGSTTFNLPDFRGIFPRGAGTSGVLDYANSSLGGFSDTLGQYSNDSLQGHYHSVRDITNNAYPSYISLSRTAGSSTGYVQYASEQTSSLQAKGEVSDGTDGTPRTSDETAPASLGINFIIKY